MARQENQKLKPLILQQALLERSDEDHTLTVGDFIDILSAWGVPAERKSIYNDLETLRQFGLDIQMRKGKEGGWFIGERPFELPELKLLVDAVQSCKFITKGKSDALISKLESLASTHQAGKLQRQVYVDRRVKTMNEGVYYIIDALHTAMAGNRAVSFQYFDYNVQKEKVYRREGHRYNVFPKGLLWDSENYYLVGWDQLSHELRHYRVDKMANLNLLALKPQGEAKKPVDLAQYSAKHFGMFSGRETQVTLDCDNTMVGVVLDRFGQDVMLIPQGSDTFHVTVRAVISPQFFGWLFGLNRQVRLISPPWAVEQWQEQLTQTLSDLL